MGLVAEGEYVKGEPRRARGFDRGAPWDGGALGMLEESDVNRRLGPRLAWNTQTANQAVGTGALVGMADLRMFGKAQQWYLYYANDYPSALRALRRALQSARIGRGAL